MAINYVKQHDTYPPAESKIVDAANQAINLTGCTVEFAMRAQYESAYKVDYNAASIVGDPLDGDVRYEWASDGSETDQAGLFFAVWRVTFPSTRRETFPQLFFDQVIVDGAL